MPNTTYEIGMPAVPTNTYAFSFSTTVAGGSWSFIFIYMNNHWMCYATPPTNSSNTDLQLIREAAIFNGVIAWEGYPDYSLLVVSAIPTPGLNDIDSVFLYLIDRRT
jgi:hypothetical protein